MHPSKNCASLIGIFYDLDKLLDEDSTTFLKVKTTASLSLKEALPAMFHDLLPEISTYFIESFGNATQHGIDYGTEHELAFIMFLCSLFKKMALTEKDYPYVGLKIFNAYLQFVHRLQLKYHMEPASSHGVSSMDNNQYVSFIWGSSQLSVKEPFEPKRSLETVVINLYKEKYYFILRIDQIRQVCNWAQQNVLKFFFLNSINGILILISLIGENG